MGRAALEGSGLAGAFQHILVETVTEAFNASELLQVADDFLSQCQQVFSPLLGTNKVSFFIAFHCRLVWQPKRIGMGTTALRRGAVGVRVGPPTQSARLLRLGGF